MTDARPTANETIDSLTGWEEIAIEKSSGKTLEMMQDKAKPNNVLMLRCLGAVLKWRENLAADPAAGFHAAYSEVMGMSQGSVGDLFGEEPDDLVPAEPDSEVGKDSLPLPGELEAKPSSVSLPESHPISTPV